MNHFLNSSFIIPNNEIKIIAMAIKQINTPKIISIDPIESSPFKAGEIRIEGKGFGNSNKDTVILLENIEKDLSYIL